MIDELKYSLENFFTGGIPSVVNALLLLILAWIVASIVRSLFQKVLVRVGLARVLSKTPAVKDEAQGERILQQIGSLVYFLVFILFLPAIFSALNMSDVSQPMSNMIDQFLGFIPNIIATVIIIAIGLFISRLVRDLFQNFFNALNLDKLFARIQPNKENHEQSQAKLSTVLATVIFILVFIPFLTIGLEALNIATISGPIQAVIHDVVNIIPNIFVAVILLAVGFYIGRFLGNLLTNVLEGVGVGKILSTFGLSTDGQKPKFDLAKILGTAVQVLVLLFFTVEALNVINLHILNTIGQAVIQYLPFLLSALIILGFGLLFANLLSNWIKKHTNSTLSAMIIQGVIITFAVFMALDQLQFATSIVNTAFLLILGGLMIAFAIAFGIGGRDFAKGRLEKLSKKIDEK